MKSVRTIDLRAWRLSGFTCTTLATWALKVLQQAGAQHLDLAAQLLVLESVSPRLGAHNDIGRRHRVVATQHVQNPEASQLSQPTLESVPIDRRLTMLRNDETNPRYCASRRNYPEIEVGCAETAAVPHGGAQLTTARQSMTPQQALIRAR